MQLLVNDRDLLCSRFIALEPRWYRINARIKIDAVLLGEYSAETSILLVLVVLAEVDETPKVVIFVHLLHDLR